VTGGKRSVNLKGLGMNPGENLGFRAFTDWEIGCTPNEKSVGMYAYEILMLWTPSQLSSREADPSPKREESIKEAL